MQGTFNALGTRSNLKFGEAKVTTDKLNGFKSHSSKNNPSSRKVKTWIFIADCLTRIPTAQIT